MDIQGLHGLTGQFGRNFGTRLLRWVAVIVWLFPALGALAGNTYYVSNSGSDTSGTGTLTNPWRTLTFARNSLYAGDTLILRGGVYREYLALLHSGTATDPIVIKGYPGERATVTAMVPTTPADWELVSGNIYRLTSLLENRTYENASQDGVPLRLMQEYNNHTGSAAALTGEGQWARFRSVTDPDELWVWAKGGGNPGTKGVEVSEIYEVIIVEQGIDHIVLEDLTVEGGYYPIRISGSHCIVRNCTIRNCFGDGIKVPSAIVTGEADWNSQYGRIENCDIYHFGESGIDITGGDYWTIQGCSIHDGVANRWVTANAAYDSKINGIMIKNNSIGTVVDGCRIYNLPKAIFGAVAIGGDTSHSDALRPSADGVVLRNTIFHNISGNYVIALLGAQNCRVSNNIVYDCAGQDVGGATSSRSIIQIREGPSQQGAQYNYPSRDNVIANNIFYHNSVTLNYHEVIDENDNGFVIDRNFVDASINSRFDGGLMSQASVVSGKGYDTTSVNYPGAASASAPVFEDWSKRLMRLAEGAPGGDDGIDFALEDGVTRDFAGVSRPLGAGYDKGAMENGLSSSRTVYSSGDSTANWVLAATTTLTTVTDAERNESVLNFSGAGLNWLFNSVGASWNNQRQFICSWMAKSTSQHSLSVRLRTKSGAYKLLKYYSWYTTTNFTDPATIRYPLGSGPLATQDGVWHGYVRDLKADLQAALPAEEIDFIDRFYVEGVAGGAVRIDNVALHNTWQSAKRPPGCVGEWRFPEMHGAYTEDSSGQGRHGTLVGLETIDPRATAWGIGPIDRTLMFPGISHAYVEAPALGTPSWDKGISIHTWVKFSNLTDTQKAIAASLTGAGDQARLLQQGNKVRFEISLDGGQLVTADSLSGLWTAGEWVHLAVVTDLAAKKIRIYVNGVESSDGGPLSFTQNSIDLGVTPLRIGSDASSGNTFTGAIDEIAIFDRALSSEEISDVMAGWVD